jgi:hypothetical protein
VADSDRSIVFLAPHLVLPARNGADVYVEGLARGVSKLRGEAIILGARQRITCVAGSILETQTFPNRIRSKIDAGIRTIARSSHYHLEKFNTKEYEARARAELAGGRYGSVVHSYLTTAKLGEGLAGTHLEAVLTHNDEFKWFEDIERRSRNPMTRRVARISHRWLHTYLAERQHELELLHVTGEDMEGWGSRIPGHRGHVVPIGVDMPSTPAPALDPEQPARLLFVGALGIGMNYDALAHFEQKFWPAISGLSDIRVEMVVVGSSPTDKVKRLARQAGWRLVPDASDQQLDHEFQSATFSILPFPYATGAKLKLLKSLSYGVPVLATEAVRAQKDLICSPSLMTNDVTAWTAHIRGVSRAGISAQSRVWLNSLGGQHSWVASARALVAVLDGQCA